MTSCMHRKRIQRNHINHYCLLLDLLPLFLSSHLQCCSTDTLISSQADITFPDFLICLLSVIPATGYDHQIYEFPVNREYVLPGVQKMCCVASSGLQSCTLNLSIEGSLEASVGYAWQHIDHDFVCTHF